jgi:hypothetical protein
MQTIFAMKLKKTIVTLPEPLLATLNTSFDSSKQLHPLKLNSTKASILDENVFETRPSSVQTDHLKSSRCSKLNDLPDCDVGVSCMNVIFVALLRNLSYSFVSFEKRFQA